MHRSVYDKLKRQIEKRLPGAVFVTREFLELGSRAALNEALSRLACEGVIHRLGRGLYDFPRLHPVFGPVPADPDQIAALKDGTVQALIAQQPYQIGVNAVDQALNRFCAPEELTGGATHREHGAPVELCAGSCCCAVQVLCPEEMTPWISSVCALHLEFC